MPKQRLGRILDYSADVLGGQVTVRAVLTLIGNNTTQCVKVERRVNGGREGRIIGGEAEENSTWEEANGKNIEAVCALPGLYEMIQGDQ